MTQGNKRAQRKRRKQNLKGLARSPDAVELIDGNYSYYAVAYCERKQAYLTKGLVDTHKCKERKCGRYFEVYRF